MDDVAAATLPRIFAGAMQGAMAEFLPACAAPPPTPRPTQAAYGERHA